MFIFSIKSLKSALLTQSVFLKGQNMGRSDYVKWRKSGKALCLFTPTNHVNFFTFCNDDTKSHKRHGIFLVYLFLSFLRHTMVSLTI